MKMILLIVYPLCSVFIVVGAWLAWTTLDGMVKARSVASWPTAGADIKKIDLRDEDTDGSESYEVLVDYEYEVDNKQFKGNQIHPAYSESSFEGHLRLYEELKKAAVVKVYINPKDPSEAYLVSGSYSAHWSAFFGGMIFFTMGIFFMLAFHFVIFGNSNYADGLHILRKAGALQVAVPAEEK